MYQAPFGIDVAANVFGRQGYPFPLFRTQALGADTGLSVLVTPPIDTFRYDNVWDTDLRVARTFKVRAVSLRVIGDLFNVANANTVLIRNNNMLLDGVQHDRPERQPANPPRRGSSSASKQNATHGGTNGSARPRAFRVFMGQRGFGTGVAPSAACCSALEFHVAALTSSYRFVSLCPRR